MGAEYVHVQNTINLHTKLRNLFSNITDLIKLHEY